MSIMALVPLLLVLAPLLFVMFRKPKIAGRQPRFALSNCSFLRMFFAFPYGLGFLYFLMALISIAQDRYVRIREADLLFFVAMTVLPFFAFLYTLFGGSLRKGTVFSSVALLQSGTDPTPQIVAHGKGDKANLQEVTMRAPIPRTLLVIAIYLSIGCLASLWFVLTIDPRLQYLFGSWVARPVYQFVQIVLVGITAYCAIGLFQRWKYVWQAFAGLTVFNVLNGLLSTGLLAARIAMMTGIDMSWAWLGALGGLTINVWILYLLYRHREYFAGSPSRTI